MDVYQNMTFKMQKWLQLLWFVPQIPIGAPPEDLASSAEPYHFSNFAGAYVHCASLFYGLLSTNPCCVWPFVRGLSSWIPYVSPA